MEAVQILFVTSSAVGSLPSGVSWSTTLGRRSLSPASNSSRVIPVRCMRKEICSSERVVERSVADTGALGPCATHESIMAALSGAAELLDNIHQPAGQKSAHQTHARPVGPPDGEGFEEVLEPI